MSYSVGNKVCQAEGCKASFPNHRWGRIKNAEGWFISRDDRYIFCPNHLPEWVAEWRAKKNERN